MWLQSSSYMEENTTELSSLEIVPETPRPVGRPVKPIDWEKVRELVSLQCDAIDIAAFCGVSEKTLLAALRREQGVSYWEEFAEPIAKTKLIDARRVIWERALGGNDRMLAMIARKYLGFEQELKVSGQVQHQHLHVLLTDEDRKKRLTELQAKLLPGS